MTMRREDEQENRVGARVDERENWLLPEAAHGPRYRGWHW